MLRPFSLLNTDPQTPEGRNWRTFDEASKTIVKSDLTFSNPVGGTSVSTGTFTLYGPIVFYVIDIEVPNGDGWTTTAYIDLPYSQLSANSTFPAPHIGMIFNNAAESFKGWAYISGVANTNRLNLAVGYTNTSGATEHLQIQGWYYRG